MPPPNFNLANNRRNQQLIQQGVAPSGAGATPAPNLMMPNTYSFPWNSQTSYAAQGGRPAWNANYTSGQGPAAGSPGVTQTAPLPTDQTQGLPNTPIPPAAWYQQNPPPDPSTATPTGGTGGTGATGPVNPSTGQPYVPDFISNFDWSTAYPHWDQLSEQGKGNIQSQFMSLSQAWAMNDQDSVNRIIADLRTVGVTDQGIQSFLGTLGGPPGTTPQAGGYNNPMYWGEAMPSYLQGTPQDEWEFLDRLTKDAYRKEQNQMSLAREGQQSLADFMNQLQSDPLAAQIASSLMSGMESGTSEADAKFGMRSSDISKWEQAAARKLGESRASRGLAGSGDLGGEQAKLLSEAHQQRLNIELARAIEAEQAKERARSAAANWYATQYGLSGTMAQNIASLPMGFQPNSLAGMLGSTPSDIYTMQNMDDWIKDAAQGQSDSAMWGGIGNVAGSLISNIDWGSIF